MQRNQQRSWIKFKCTLCTLLYLKTFWAKWLDPTKLCHPLSWVLGPVYNCVSTTLIKSQNTSVADLLLTIFFFFFASSTAALHTGHPNAMHLFTSKHTAWEAESEYLRSSWDHSSFHVKQKHIQSDCTRNHTPRAAQTLFCFRHFRLFFRPRLPSRSASGGSDSDLKVP